MAYQRQTGQMHPMLADAPVLPDDLRYLWANFLELHSSRGLTMAGPARIGFVDIDAWMRVRGVDLESWELDAIRRADDEYLAQSAKQRKARAH